ncbi:penicillin-binding transpeptidase domain-containing protein [Actinacidiphila paucisporea]|uniref:NTF2-like N-terminal transpeptidase domain-containing protein n=1 Tax=Actinacidiphila paucisporea TaxID=310782 RepID=A0A1M7H3H2_9ACTN|nr:penicillin-binding transpeptidase domain-containing protein [Actinacidiphila paucisporea]SHM22936.1 NTF2-like N-terminal transpeptidase domain-containing protein [Actinacidiphila paucisporea]
MPEYLSTVNRRRRKSRRTWRTVAVVAALCAAAAAGTYAVGVRPLARGGAGGAPAPDPAAVSQAHAFLADWAAGRRPGAAARTTSPDSARQVLDNFTEGLDIGRPVLTPAAATRVRDGAVTVPFTARMPITGLGTWTYASKLSLGRQDDGTWKVDWALSVVHPDLSPAAKFHLEREEAAAPQAFDRHGKVLSGAALSSLGPALGSPDGGTGGAVGRGSVQLVDRATGRVERTEATFGAAPGTQGGSDVHTTLDAAWQSSAERALAAGVHGRNAGLVALRIDSGEVLALANSPSTGFDRAVSGTYAPGSTWKIVTSSALLLKGAVAPRDTVDCPKHLTVGKEFHNVETSEHPGATFLDDFAESCNTAFISLRGRLGDQELGRVARTYFGVGQDWHVGVPSFDGSVPVAKDETEKAASMIGQGRLQANPLVMASVTATAVSGAFHQPRITGKAEDETSTTALPPAVVAQLRTMMRATVTRGTARILADLPGAVGAKTGTAEVSDDEPNNGWLVAYRGNVAVACVVEQGVTGGGSAGPVIHDLLSANPTDPS